MTTRNLLIALLSSLSFPAWAAFTIPTTADTTPPVLSQGPQTAAVTGTSARIEWTTDEASNALVRYGLSAGALTLQNGDLDYGTTHRVVLTKLSSATTYYAQVISADPMGNPTTSAVFNFTTGAASVSPQTIGVISVTPAVLFYAPGGTFTVTATGGGSGNPVTFASQTTAVCTTGGSNGATVTIQAVGTCTLAANQTGNTNYAAAPQVTQAFVITKAAQTITFGTAPTIAVGATGTVSAAGGSSGNPVVLTTTTPAVCSISGTTVTGLTSGTCTIAANQAGNSNYNVAAQVTQNIGIGLGAQAAVAVNAPGSLTYGTTATLTATGGSGTGNFTFSTGSSTGCSVAGIILSVTDATGNCAVTAGRAGDSNYNAATSPAATVALAKAAQAITFGTAPTIQVGGTGSASATGGTSGNAVTFTTTTASVCSVSGSTVIGISTGTCTIAANQAGSNNYLAATQVTQSFGIGAPPGVLTRDPPALAFGGQSLNTTAPTQTVTITNSGGSAVGITTIATATPFAVTHNCGSSLNAGASCTARVTFTPTAQGGANGALSITADVATLSTALSGVGEKSLVTHFYQAIMRRAPDVGGKNYWEGIATTLPTWGASVNETWFAMAMTFYSSPEYQGFKRDDTAFITDLYRTFFNREPEGGGLNYWVGVLSRGTPREVVLASFMFSTEFVNFTQAIFGNTAARAEANVVMDFYRGLLGRLPDQGGYDHWLAQIRSAQCIDANAVRSVVNTISQQFLTSGEYYGRSRSNGQFVGDLYNSHLRRGGDEAGVTHWITQLNTSQLTREQERVAFLASPEFTGRVNAVIAEGCRR